jgi:hypothetical protein
VPTQDEASVAIQVAIRLSYCVFTVLGMCYTVFGDDISLGGVRRVRGSVQVENSRYAILVVFDPVRSLTPPLNRKINLSKGRHYAIRMLARHLGASGSTRITVSQMSLGKLAHHGDTVECLFTVPVDRVSLSGDAIQQGRRGEPSAAAVKQSDPDPVRHRSSPHQSDPESVLIGPAGTDLLARTPDYLDTIDRLVHSWHASLPESPATQDMELFQQVDQECWAILKEIEADRLLLKHEKILLSERLTDHLERFLGTLTDRSGRLTNTADKEDGVNGKGQ